MKNKRIRLARVEADMLAKELAEAMNVNPRTVSRWEHGHVSPTLDQLREMAAILNTTASYLAGDTTEVAA